MTPTAATPRLRVRNLVTPTPRLRVRTLVTLLVGIMAVSPAVGDTVAEDQAHFGAYHDGWQNGEYSGKGFGAWELTAPQQGEGRYAGFFIAEANREPDIGAVARDGKAFGIYANGIGFEEALAYRPLAEALKPGDILSLSLNFDGFVGDADETDTDAMVGVALVERFTRDGETRTRRRAVFGLIESLSTYQIVDGAHRLNTRIFLDPVGVTVSFILRADARYDLEVHTLGDDKVYRFEDRRLLVTEEPEDDGTVTGLSLFNRNAGANNAYFNALQIFRRNARP